MCKEQAKQKPDAAGVAVEPEVRLPINQKEAYEHAENIQQIMNEANFRNLSEWRLDLLKKLEKTLIDWATNKVQP